MPLAMSDFLEAQLRVLDSPDALGPDGALTPEAKRQLDQIAAWAQNPQEAEAALGGQGPEATPEETEETEADEELTRGPETEDAGVAERAEPEAYERVADELPPPEKLDDPEVRDSIRALYESLGVPAEHIDGHVAEAKKLLAEEPEKEIPQVAGLNSGQKTGEEEKIEPGGSISPDPLKAQYRKLAERAEKLGDKHSAAIYRRAACA